jgi:hypothetical protein
MTAHLFYVTQRTSWVSIWNSKGWVRKKMVGIVAVKRSSSQFLKLFQTKTMKWMWSSPELTRVYEEANLRAWFSIECKVKWVYDEDWAGQLMFTTLQRCHLPFQVFPQMFLASNLPLFYGWFSVISVIIDDRLIWWMDDCLTLATVEWPCCSQRINNIRTIVVNVHFPFRHSLC